SHLWSAAVRPESGQAPVGLWWGPDALHPSRAVVRDAADRSLREQSAGSAICGLPGDAGGVMPGGGLRRSVPEQVPLRPAGPADLLPDPAAALRLPPPADAADLRPVLHCRLALPRFLPGLRLGRRANPALAAAGAPRSSRRRGQPRLPRRGVQRQRGAALGVPARLDALPGLLAEPVGTGAEPDDRQDHRGGGEEAAANFRADPAAAGTRTDRGHVPDQVVVLLGPLERHAHAFRPRACRGGVTRLFRDESQRPAA